jgi:hypothetical protein
MILTNMRASCNRQSGLLRPALIAAILLVAVGIAFGGIESGFVPDPEDPTIAYGIRPTTDRISVLNREIEAGRVQLKFDGEKGYLRSALSVLHIPIESQMAVFSKTSVQARLIDPHNPRTLFFDDSVVVGWVRGGFIEIAAQDPQQGVVFYTLAQTPVEKPQFTRHDECLQCHNSNNAIGVPGMLVRSQFTAPNGEAMRWLGSYVTDHRSPLEERWGGWYVTGKSGAIRHMGNAVVKEADKPESVVTEQTLNLESLQGKFETDAYLSPYSDIVALMVFEHQMHMMNLLTRIGWQTRYALRSGNRGDLKANDLNDTTEALVDYMLFVDEAPLANKIEGTSGFAENFSLGGPHDSLGRSFRQLDLERRLMRYSCSYMIYSEAFDSLPSEAKDAIYKRMWRILSGELSAGKYARLSLSDRQAVVGILRETKKELPDYFQPVTH